MAAETIEEKIARAGQSQGPAGATQSTATTPGALQVFLGRNPSPDRGPAMQADVSIPEGPSDRGPSMHFEPPRLAWADLRKPFVSDKTMDAEAAANLIYTWSGKERRKWEKVLLEAGLIEPGNYNFADLVELWQGAVEGAAKLHTLGGKNVTPQQYVRNFIGVNGIGGSGGGSEPSTTRRTDRSVAHFDDLDAQGIARDAYSAFLGRAATAEEERALKAALNEYAKAHPSIVTTTTRDDGKGNVTTTTRDKGGFDAADAGELVTERIQKKPEYASYQAAATYFPVLEQALDSVDLAREF